MKAKYKLDNLIRYTHEGAELTGILKAVVTRKVGFSYFIEGSDYEIPEHNVLDAYKPIMKKLRKRRTLESLKEKRAS